MFEYRLAYRHQNGEVEGFRGRSLIAPAEAKAFACKKIVEKLELLGEPKDSSRLIESPDGLSEAEMEQIKRDWDCE